MPAPQQSAWSRGTRNRMKHAFSSEMTQALSVASRLLLSKVWQYLPSEVSVSSLEAGVLEYGVWGGCPVLPGL